MKTILCLLLTLWIGGCPAKANIKLPALISDGMVLQRDQSVKIWGWADAGELIIIRSRSKQYQAKTSSEGNWEVKIEPSPAGGPYDLTINGRNTTTVKTILMGDVWLCAGQSNMEYNIAEGIINQKAEVAAANYPQIRLVQVAHRMSLLPHDNLETTGWIACTSQSVPHFSATAYFFGRALYQKYHVPIGLITAAWGGTPIEAWLSYDALKQVKSYKAEVEQFQEIAPNQAAYIKK